MTVQLNKKQFAAGFALGFLVALILAGAVTRMMVRRHRNPGKFQGKIVEHLEKKLELSAEQTAQVREILKGRFAQMREVRMMGRMRHDRISARTREQINAVLTTSQRQQFRMITQKMDKKRERWRHGPKGRRRGR
jgi:Spy/CpxP family protein refolding chaperone